MRNKCTIAIYGKPQSGKSTLLRRITKKYVEKDHVSRGFEEHGICYLELSNLQRAGYTLGLLESGNSDVNRLLHERLSDKDIRIIEYIRHADLVYYVIRTDNLVKSVNQQIDDLVTSILTDLDLTIKLNKKLLVILNTSLDEKLKGNCKNLSFWKKELEKKGISFYHFNFLWDDFSNVINELKKITSKCLSNERTFNIESINKQNEERRQKIAEKIDCTLKSFVNVYQVTSSQNKSNQDNITQDLTNLYKDYIDIITELYSIKLNKKELKPSDNFVLGATALFLGKLGGLGLLIAGSVLAYNSAIKKYLVSTNAHEEMFEYLKSKDIVKIYTILIAIACYISFFATEDMSNMATDHILILNYLKEFKIPSLINELKNEGKYKNNITQTILERLNI